MNQSISNILNIKLSSIISKITLDNNVAYKDIYKYIKKKKYLKLDESYYKQYMNNNNNNNNNESILIEKQLIDYLQNDPKFLIYNNSIKDVQIVLIKYAQANNLKSDCITINFINDIIISYINSSI